MSISTSPARHAVWLLLAALASFTGSIAMLKGTGAFAAQRAALPDAGIPALGAYMLVILLGLGGLVLAAMAAKELLDLRRQSHLR